MANPAIWPGSSSFATGSTPFGFYDDGITEYDYKEPPTMVVKDGDDSWLS